MKMHFCSPCLKDYIQAKNHPCKVALVLEIAKFMIKIHELRLNKYNFIVKLQCAKEKQIQIKVGKTKTNERGKIFF